MLVGVHQGLPCNSWSRARDQPGGPPPLRSDQHVMGLPDLQRPGDVASVRVGNALMWLGVRFARACRAFGIPWSIENPARSRLWIAPQMSKLSRMRNVVFSVTHYCMWGASWRKPTGFLTWGLVMESIDSVRCIGAKRGLCVRTGEPHVVLSGKGPDGTFKTLLANPYPKKLCQALARAYMNADVASRASLFEKYQRRRGQ